MSESIRLWLDDERPAPDGWLHVRTAPEALSIIRGGNVTEASLDHDLGDEPYTGYWLLTRIEDDVARGVGYALPLFSIHTANPVGYRKMYAARKSILTMVEMSARA